MAGLGYQVNAGVNFESNGVAVMRALADAVKAASVTVDANTKAVMANSRAIKAMAASIRDAVSALGTESGAIRANTVAVDAVTAAYNRATAAVSRFNAAALGAAAFGPRASATVIPNIPAITRAQAGALGASAFADRYYSSAWSQGQRALPTWRGGQVPAVYQPGPNWRQTAGTGWEYGGYRGSGEPWPMKNITPYTGVPFGAQRTFRVGGPPEFGEGPPRGGGGWPSLPSIGGISKGIGRFTGGPMGHILELVSGVDAVVEAMRLQLALQSVQNITGANKNQMDLVRQQMFDVGNVAGMSPVQATSMFREIVRMTQGAFVPGVLDKGVSPLDAQLGLMPYLARMQVVLHSTRGYSPQMTSDAALEAVHLLQMYDPKEMEPGFDLLTRAMELSPVTPSQMVTQLKQFAPVMKTSGVLNEQILSLLVTLSRAGFGTGRGGTGLAQLMTQSLGPLQVTSFQQAIKTGYLHQIGMLTGKDNLPSFYDQKTGEFNFLQMLKDMGQFEQRHGKVYANRMFMGIFGQAGGRIGDYLAQPVIQKQIESTYTTMTGQKSLGLMAQFTKFMDDTALNQVVRAAQNFQALMTEIGWVALPAVTLAAKDMAGALHEAQQWLNKNKELTKSWSESMVKDVESAFRYLTSKEFIANAKQTGRDLLVLASEMKSLAEWTAKISMGPTVGLVRVLADILGQQWGDIPAALRSGGTLDYLNPFGSHPAAVKPVGISPGDFRARQRWALKHPGMDPTGAVGHSHGDSKRNADATVGSVQIIIQGAGKNAKEIADLVDARFKALLRNPRGFQAGNSESRTHKGLPKSLSVGTA